MGTRVDFAFWLKTFGVVVSLALGGTSLGLCTRGWVTPAEAATEHGKLKAEIESLDARIQQQTLERFDAILEKLP